MDPADPAGSRGLPPQVQLPLPPAVFDPFAAPGNRAAPTPPSSGERQPSAPVRRAEAHVPGASILEAIGTGVGGKLGDGVAALEVCVWCISAG